jgi:hypothetical protein
MMRAPVAPYAVRRREQQRQLAHAARLSEELQTATRACRQGQIDVATLQQQIAAYVAFTQSVWRIPVAKD